MTKIEGPATSFTTSATQTTTQTWVITELDYTGTYDEQVEPVVSLLKQLKVKLLNAKKITFDAEVNAGIAEGKALSDYNTVSLCNRAVWCRVLFINAHEFYCSTRRPMEPGPKRKTRTVIRALVT